MKRTQKDYSMPFNLSSCAGSQTTIIGLTAAAENMGYKVRPQLKRWLEKYGTFDWKNIKGKCRKRKTKSSEVTRLIFLRKSRRIHTYRSLNISVNQDDGDVETIMGKYSINGTYGITRLVSISRSMTLTLTASM